MMVAMQYIIYYYHHDYHNKKRVRWMMAVMEIHFSITEIDRMKVLSEERLEVNKRVIDWRGVLLF